MNIASLSKAPRTGIVTRPLSISPFLSVASVTKAFRMPSVVPEFISACSLVAFDRFCLEALAVAIRPPFRGESLCFLISVIYSFHVSSFFCFAFPADPFFKTGTCGMLFAGRVVYSSYLSFALIMLSRPERQTTLCRSFGDLIQRPGTKVSLLFPFIFFRSL